MKKKKKQTNLEFVPYYAEFHVVQHKSADKSMVLISRKTSFENKKHEVFVTSQRNKFFEIFEANFQNAQIQLLIIGHN